MLPEVNAGIPCLHVFANCAMSTRAAYALNWDDAWDSGSEDEETISAKTKPKPVLSPKASRTESDYAFIQRPSSYPPQTPWTVINNDLDESNDLPDNLKAGPSKSTIRPDADKILEDPLHLTQHFHVRSSSPQPTTVKPQSKASLARERSLRTNRRHKFVECLSQADVSITDLRKLAWSGIPPVLRPIAWSLLLGYLPLAASQRCATLTRKRAEYQNLVELTFAKGRDGLDQSIWHQIEIDVPRTRPGIKLWMCQSTQRVRHHFISILRAEQETVTESRKNPLRMGHPTSCKWLCARHQ